MTTEGPRPIFLESSSIKATIFLTVHDSFNLLVLQKHISFPMLDISLLTILSFLDRPVVDER